MAQSLAEMALERIDSGRARIPVFDSCAVRAQEMLATGSFEIDELEQLVERDAGLASALLRAANSSFFGGLEKVVTIRDAILRLGARKTCQLLVVLSQKQSYRMQSPPLQAMAEALWRHSLACALGCDWLARRLRLGELDAAAMLAGLLHDVGKLYLLGVIDELVSGKDAKFEPSEALVLEVTRTLHCEQGGRLLEAWNIPDPYRRVVLKHHDEEVAESEVLLLVVRLVDRVCSKLGIGLEPMPDLDPSTTSEAQALRASEVLLAELELQIEDALQIGS